jgi:AcrR family transcriptional regulator
MKEPLRQRKKNQTRAAIIERAARIFRRKGFEATTLEEIAEAVDVHKQTVLRYFSSKEEIAFAHRIALFETFSEQLGAREGSVLAHWRRYIEQTSVGAGQSGSKVDELKAWFQFLDSDLRLFAYQLRLNERYQATLADALSREAGVDPSTDVFAQSLAALLVSGNANVARMIVRNGDVESLQARLLEVVDLAARLKRDNPQPA